jgi:hypothetical protein
VPFYKKYDMKKLLTIMVLVLIATVVNATETFTLKGSKFNSTQALEITNLPLEMMGSVPSFAPSAKPRGTGLMIGGLVTLGVGVATFGGLLIYAAVDPLNLAEIMKNAMIASYVIAITVPVGIVLSIVGGVMRASNKSTAYVIPTDNILNGSYASLGATGNGIGFSFTF